MSDNGVLDRNLVVGRSYSSLRSNELHRESVKFIGFQKKQCLISEICYDIHA